MQGIILGDPGADSGGEGPWVSEDGKASALITTLAIVSSITVTVLTVERYNALLKPLRTGLRLSEDSIKKAIALIWVTTVFFKSRCEVEE